MRYCLFSFILALVLVTVGAGQETKGKPKEPKETKSTEVTEVAGKNFEQWVAEIKESDPSKREEAYRMILQFGPEKAYRVAPQILADLKRHTSFTPVDLSVRVNGTLAISTIFKHMQINKKEIDKKDLREAITIFTRTLDDPQVIMRVRTVQALPYLGPETRNEITIKQVVKMVRDKATWEARQAAIQTLMILAFDEKGAPAAYVMTALYTAIDDKAEPSSRVRQAGVAAIQTVGSGGMPQATRNGMIGKLYQCLKDKSPTVRYAAVQAITSLAMGADPADKQKIIHRLADDSLTDSVGPVRYVTVQGLVHLSSAAPPVLKAEVLTRIQPRLKDSEPTVQMITNIAIMAVRDKYTKDHIDPICALAEKGELGVRVAALQHLTMLGTHAEPAIPRLTALCRDKDVNIGTAAMGALVSLNAYESISALRSIKEDKMAAQVLRDAAHEAIEDLIYIKKAADDRDKKKDKK